MSTFHALSLSVVFLNVGSLAGIPSLRMQPQSTPSSQPTRQAIRWAVRSPPGTLALPTTQPQTQQQPRATQPRQEFGCARGASFGKSPTPRRQCSSRVHLRSHCRRTPPSSLHHGLRPHLRLSLDQCGREFDASSTGAREVPALWLGWVRCSPRSRRRRGRGR